MGGVGAKLQVLLVLRALLEELRHHVAGLGGVPLGVGERGIEESPVGAPEPQFAGLSEVVQGAPTPGGELFGQVVEAGAGGIGGVEDAREEMAAPGEPRGGRGGRELDGEVEVLFGLGATVEHRAGAGASERGFLVVGAEFEGAREAADGFLEGALMAGEVGVGAVAVEADLVEEVEARFDLGLGFRAGGTGGGALLR